MSPHISKATSAAFSGSNTLSNRILRKSRLEFGQKVGTNLAKHRAIVALSIVFLSLNPATAEIRLFPPVQIKWPFGEYYSCLGPRATQQFKKKMGAEYVSTITESRRLAMQNGTGNIKLDAILNEHILAAHEFTLNQCKRRGQGRVFSTECPLGVLSNREAVSSIGRKKNRYWTVEANRADLLRRAQQDHLEALLPRLISECG